MTRERRNLKRMLGLLMSLILRTQHSHEYLTAWLLDEAPIWVKIFFSKAAAANMLVNSVDYSDILISQMIHNSEKWVSFWQIPCFCARTNNFTVTDGSALLHEILRKLMEKHEIPEGEHGLIFVSRQQPEQRSSFRKTAALSKTNKDRRSTP